MKKEFVANIRLPMDIAATIRQMAQAETRTFAGQVLHLLRIALKEVGK